MANFDVSNADFSTVLRELEITDRGHADTFNPLFLRLIKNDTFLKAYVDQQISNLINGAPGALDTLKELADALGDDANFQTTILNTIAAKTNQADFNNHVNALTAHGIGDRTQLKTAAKDTIVNALNELKTAIPSVPVQSINGKTGSVSLGASDITVSDSSNHFSSNPKNVENVLAELFQSASSGKSAIATAAGSPSTSSETFSQLATDIINGKNNIYNAITGKGTTPSSKNFADLVSAIGNISTGKKYANGTMNADLQGHMTLNSLSFRPKYIFITQNQYSDYAILCDDDISIGRNVYGAFGTGDSATGMRVCGHFCTSTGFDIPTSYKTYNPDTMYWYEAFGW